MDSKKAIIFEIVRHISLPGWRFPNSAEYKAVLSELGIKYAEVNSELRVRFNGHNKAVKAFRCAEITDKHTVIIDGTLIEAGETFNLEKIMNTFQTINRARRMGKGEKMENRSLKELYEKLVSKRQHEGKELPTVLIENRILGYPVYRGTTEGGEYDEVLYVTEEGTVVYGLVQNIPQHTHTCPYYETHGAEELISRCNNDGMNMLPKIEL